MIFVDLELACRNLRNWKILKSSGLSAIVHPACEQIMYHFHTKNSPDLKRTRRVDFEMNNTRRELLLLPLIVHNGYVLSIMQRFEICWNFENQWKSSSGGSERVIQQAGAWARFAARWPSAGVEGTRDGAARREGTCLAPRGFPNCIKSSHTTSVTTLKRLERPTIVLVASKHFW